MFLRVVSRLGVNITGCSSCSGYVMKAGRREQGRQTMLRWGGGNCMESLTVDPCVCVCVNKAL